MFNIPDIHVFTNKAVNSYLVNKYTVQVMKEFKYIAALGTPWTLLILSRAKWITNFELIIPITVKKIFKEQKQCNPPITSNDGFHHKVCQ